MTPAQPSYRPNIKKITQGTTTDANGKIVPGITVEYTIGAHGPFQETLPKASFDPAAIKAAMQAMAQKIEGAHQ
jgi:hypothetical protein